MYHLPSSALKAQANQVPVLAYKKGKFSIEEAEAITAYVEEFKKVNQISAHTFAEMVVALGKKEDFPRFWNDLGMSIHYKR